MRFYNRNEGERQDVTPPSPHTAAHSETADERRSTRITPRTRVRSLPSDLHRRVEWLSREADLYGNRGEPIDFIRRSATGQRFRWEHATNFDERPSMSSLAKGTVAYQLPQWEHKQHALVEAVANK